MAILTQLPSRQWQVTLNRVETQGEATLTPSHFTISGNPVTSISGTGLQRDLTLTNAVSILTTSSITILAHTGMMVVSTLNVNTELLGYIEQVRKLIWTSLTATDLPDAVIRENVYLGLAEIETLKSLGLTTAQYNTKADADAAFALRARISTVYRTAAYLLPAVPQLLREEIESEYQQFAQVDLKEKQTFFLNAAGDSIKEDVPEGTSGTISAVGKRYVKRTYF